METHGRVLVGARFGAEELASFGVEPGVVEIQPDVEGLRHSLARAESLWVILVDAALPNVALLLQDKHDWPGSPPVMLLSRSQLLPTAAGLADVLPRIHETGGSSWAAPLVAMLQRQPDRDPSSGRIVIHCAV